RLRPLPLHDALPISASGQGGRVLLGGELALALELAAEVGVVFPVAQRACRDRGRGGGRRLGPVARDQPGDPLLLGPSLAPSAQLDRKSTRLNSSHQI